MSPLDQLYWRRFARQHDADSVERQLSAFRLSTPAEARRALAERLRDQLRFFARRPDALPEWRDASAIDDLDRFWSAWPSLPLLTKGHLQHRFSARSLQAGGVDGQAGATGGSTGEPTTFIHDRALTRTIAALAFLCRREMGWIPGMPTICVWGAQRDIGIELHGVRKMRHALTRRLSRLHEVDGFSLSEETARRVYDRLMACRDGVAIYGFSSMLEHVSAVVKARGWPVPRGRVKVAWNGGEMLHASQVAAFHDLFGVPILNYYGGRELGTLAYQQETGGPLQLVRPFVFVELVSDDGRPVAPGTPGRVIVTSTTGRGTPFLRYDVGDMATAESHSIDESGITRLDALAGRAGSVLRLPNGAIVSNNYWNHLLKELDGVRQFQVVLRRGGGVKLNFVGTPVAADRERWLRSVLADFLGPVPVEIAWVDVIPPTKLGKRLQVVVE